MKKKIMKISTKNEKKWGAMKIITQKYIWKNEKKMRSGQPVVISRKVSSNEATLSVQF